MRNQRVGRNKYSLIISTNHSRKLLTFLPDTSAHWKVIFTSGRRSTLERGSIYLVCTPWQFCSIYATVSASTLVFPKWWYVPTYDTCFHPITRLDSGSPPGRGSPPWWQTSWVRRQKWAPPHCPQNHGRPNTIPWELLNDADRKQRHHHVIFQKEWIHWTGKEVMKGDPCCTACWALD